VRYHLRLYPLPQAIWASSYCYALDDLESVAEWLGETARTLSEKIELTLFLVHAPPELSENGKVGLVTATVFADSEEEARALLEPLAACPVADPLAEVDPAPTDFPTLFDLSGSMWPENQRAHVDAMFFDTSPAELVRAASENFVSAPSETTPLLFCIYTGPPDVPAPLPADAAFSMSARLYGGPWTQWADPADDAANLEWHAECVDLLKPFAVGHYVGESDTAGHPEFAEGAYSAANWKKLAELCAKHDPDGVFFSYSDGL
nr:FAD-binding oxidoreductase [Actinomycetota bacterium]